MAFGLGARALEEAVGPRAAEFHCDRIANCDVVLVCGLDQSPRDAAADCLVPGGFLFVVGGGLLTKLQRQLEKDLRFVDVLAERVGDGVVLVSALRC